MIASEDERADHLFTQALNIANPLRDAFLVKCAGNDAALLEGVRAMLVNYDRISNFLEAPVQLSQEPVLRPGDVLVDRFQIVNFLARGGMGQVYAAWDLLLKETLAIKTIGAPAGREKWFAEQFREEIKLGRRVSHRNICRIHEIYEHVLESGRILVFSAMELLEGETLARLLARQGALSVTVSLPILTDILSGLAEAHYSGIVHRDFKPGNVIVTGTRAVITDFGLAQLQIDSGADYEMRGAIAGSLPYMAPEQFTQSRVTQAADIFAVGVLLYEMVTGKLPFPVTSVTEALEARLSESYIAPTTWQKLIARCLCPVPRKRPADVESVLREIKAGPMSRRTVLVAGLAGAASVAIGVYRSRQTSAITAGMPVLLLPVAEKSHKVSAAVDQLLRTQLDQSAHFELLRSDRIAEVLHRMGRVGVDLTSDRKTAREVALREGAPLVVSAELNGPYNLDLRVEIEKVGSHPYFSLAKWTKVFHADSERELTTSAGEAATWIRRLVGEHANELARRDRSPEEATTQSWEGLLEYVEAESARAHGEDAEAVRRLHSALALDPGFALARMRLADVLIGLGRDDEAYPEWKQAVTLLESRHLTNRESFRIKTLYFHDTSNYEEAEKAATAWASDFPNDYLPLFYLADSQKRMGRIKEALQSLDSAHRKAPANPHVLLNRAQAYMEAGDLEKAKSDLYATREVNSWWWQYMAEHYFVAGAPREAWRHFDYLANLGTEWRSKAFALKACLLVDCGQDERALEYLNAGIAYDRSVGRLATHVHSKQLWLASCALRLNRRKDALDSISAALHQSPQAGTLLRASILFYAAGEHLQAKRTALRAASTLDLPVYRALSLRYQGTQALHSSPSQAVYYFDQARRYASAENPGNRIAEALLLAGKSQAAAELYRALVRYPARYWLEPERQDPGIYREALSHIAQFDPSAKAKLRSLDDAGRELALCPLPR